MQAPVKTSFPRARVVRSVIAITAAYAVALQMLLGAVLGAQAGVGFPPDTFVICFGNGSQDEPRQPGQPAVDHDLCARLCAQALAAAADIPPATPVVALMRADGQTIGRPLPPPLRLAPRPSPKRAQGPPAIA